MKVTLAGVVTLTLASVVIAYTSNPGAFTGAWDYSWDFDDGTQGWVLSGASAAWQSGSGVGGSGALYLPDTNNATWDATAFKLCGYANSSDPSKHRFVFQADVFVAATNYLQGSGIGAYRTGDKKGPWITGTAASSQGMSANDKSWWGSTRNKSWGLAVGQWTTVQLDYGYSTTGWLWARYTACPGNGAGWPAGSWAEIVPDGSSYNVTHPSDLFATLQIGGGFNGAQTGWSQAVFDNVRLAIIPEPTTFALLAIGLFGVIRRRGD